MPSKLRKAIGAVKDQTSISLAKVTNAANLEITILKATTHDKNPIEERYVNEIVQLVSSNKVYAAVCAQCIGKRIGKTRNWVVAVKSLMIILRIFQDGDPYFPREVFHAMKRGAKILNLSSFKDDSNSSPGDYTAFVRTFALYLDERLDCFLTGKLQRRFTYHNRFHEKSQRNKLSNEPGIKDMKPTMVLDRITYWQRLLDRAIGTRPTGSAKTNRLVQISLYAIVQESFDLYRDISDGLAVVIDNFFHLPYQACANAFNACVQSFKQFDELSAFYSFCSSMGVGRSYEYPNVKKISEELMETIQEFLKDQPPANNNGSKNFLFLSPKDLATSSSSQDEGIEKYGSKLERFFGSGSDFGSQCTSLEDLMSATDAALSPRRTLEEDMYSEKLEEDEKDSQYDGSQSQYSGSTKSFQVDQTSRSILDTISFDGLLQQNQTNEWEQQSTYPSSGNGSKDCWELVLIETVTAPKETSPELTNGFEPFGTLYNQLSVPQNQYNPFLEDIGTVAPAVTTNPILKSQASFNDSFYAEPTFNATTSTFCAQDPLAPTFSGQSSNFTRNLDLFFGNINPNESTTAPTFIHQGSTNTNMTLARTFPAKEPDNMIAASSFQAQHSFKNNDYYPPIFQEYNSYERCTSPMFSVQNVYVTNETPTHTTKNPNTNMVPLTFPAPNFYLSTVAPTFSAKDCNERTPKEDDPFEPWSSANINEAIPNVSMQDQTWLRQQQLWLEQQNKIIAKHMTLSCQMKMREH